MNLKFVFRGTLVALAFLAVLLLAAYQFLPQVLPYVPFGPTLRSPAITALRGNLPDEWAGMEARAVYSGSEPALAGSGFLFRLPSGSPVAALAAHSFDWSRGMQTIQLGPDGSAIDFDVLHGAPGTPRVLSMNLTNDYVLLAVPVADPAAFILTPDERGMPQPGERVVLYPGFGAQNGERLGTVLESDRKGAWVVMDEAFEPGMMSGSPFVSVHTGKVVGMALAAGLREGHTVIGMHPIGSLVEKGLDAADLIPLSEYQTD